METAPVLPSSLTCPNCHVDVRITDFYCYNCGTKLHASTTSQSAVGTQALLYVASALLPPAGLFWGLKYLRKPDSSSKVSGLVMIGITIVVIILSLVVLINFMSTPGLSKAAQSENPAQLLMMDGEF